MVVDRLEIGTDTMAELIVELRNAQLAAAKDIDPAFLHAESMSVYRRAVQEIKRRTGKEIDGRFAASVERDLQRLHGLVQNYVALANASSSLLDKFNQFRDQFSYFINDLASDHTRHKIRNIDIDGGKIHELFIAFLDELGVVDDEKRAAIRAESFKTSKTQVGFSLQSFIKRFN